MASYMLKIISLFFLICVCFVLDGESNTIKRPVSELCLGCICSAISNCQSRVCKGHLCGIFTISRPFWVDAGKPTIEGRTPDDVDAYQSCANEDYCAVETVQGYMSKFKQDCNRDGRVSCYDYLAIHQLGGYRCNGSLPQSRLKIFNQCLVDTNQD